jgi:hypothetical protein
MTIVLSPEEARVVAIALDDYADACDAEAKAAINFDEKQIALTAAATARAIQRDIP